MVAESWSLNILGIIFAVIVALVIIIKILPRVSDLTNAAFGDERITGSLMSLLVILVYVLLFLGVITLIKNINNKYLNYVSILDPGIELLVELLPYLRWVILALILGAALAKFKR
jgi:hypothetical protein